MEAKIHAATEEANADDEDSQQNVCRRRYPERVPVERRMTVMWRGVIVRDDLVVQRIDPHVA